MSSTLLRTGAGVFLSLSAAALGQTWPCVEGWQGLGIPGVAGQLGTYSVKDLKWWDPDGPGPRAPLVLVAGSFMAAGTLVGSTLVGYNPESRTWTHVSSPISGTVNAVLPMNDGTFFAAGSFSGPELPNGSRLAFWDGSAWRDESIGIESPVLAIARLHSGELVVSTYVNILRQTEAGWAPLHGSEIFGGANVLKVDSAGRLFAAGDLYSPWGSDSVLMWDGASWSRIASYGGGLPDAEGMGFLEPLPDGCMLIGSLLGGVAKWCDGVLTQMPRLTLPGLTFAIVPWGRAASLQADGSVVIECAYQILPRTYNYLQLRLRPDYTWEDTAGYGAFVGEILSIGPNRLLYATSSRFGLREYDNGVRRSLGDGLTSSPYTSFALPDGRAFISGDFDAVGSTQLQRIASYDGVSLQPLAGGLDVACRCGLQLPDGSVAIGGNFSGFYEAGMLVPSPRVARWTGTQWQPMGINGVGRVRALFLDAQQRLHAVADSSNAGISPLQRRDGDTWTPVPVPAGFAEFRAVVDEPDGSKVLGCNNGVLFRWNGSGLAQLASPRVFVGLNALLRLPSGDLIIGGANSSNPTAVLTRFNRQAGTWSFLGSPLNGSITSLAPLPRPDGGADVLVGGEFTIAGSATSRYIARWVPETNQWFSVGTGANAPVRSIARLASGEILVAGDFTVFDGKAAAYISMYRIPCPADFTCDTLVDGDDVIEFFRAWDTNDLRADFDNDGATTSADVVAFLQTWDTGC